MLRRQPHVLCAFHAEVLGRAGERHDRRWRLGSCRAHPSRRPRYDRNRHGRHAARQRRAEPVARRLAPRRAARGDDRPGALHDPAPEHSDRLSVRIHVRRKPRVQRDARPPAAGGIRAPGSRAAAASPAHTTGRGERTARVPLAQLRGQRRRVRVPRRSACVGPWSRACAVRRRAHSPRRSLSGLCDERSRPGEL